MSDAAPSHSDSLPTSVPIIILASACWETVTPVNVHQIARRFAARGHRVLFVESTGVRAPSVASSHDLGRIRRRLARSFGPPREVEPNLFTVAPLALPGGGPRWLRVWSMRRIARSVARASRALRMESSEAVLWAFLPTYLETLRRVPASLRIYHCVDHYAANPGVDAAWLDELERSICAEADMVFATSPVLANRLRQIREDVELLPNVADVALFGRALTKDLPEPDALRGLPHPRAVYVGNLARYRIDLEALDHAAAALPEFTFLFIGVIGAGDLDDAQRADDPLRRLRDRPNVRFIAPQAQHDLPSFLKHADVALIPFLDNAHTRGSLPLKLWEYAAAGLPIVARDLPNFQGPASEGVARLFDDVPTFVDAIQAAVAETPEQRAVRARAAQHHDWESRITTLALRLEKTRHSPDFG